MTGTTSSPQLCQVAFSVIDLARTERWFREGLGFAPAGGARAAMRGPLASRVQGVPHIASTCWWLVDRNRWFQLELFQFERPVAQLMPADRSPSDIGYSRIGVWVADFDAALARLDQLGSAPLAAPIGEPGARRASVRNPDGVFVEIMEADPLTDVESSAARSTCPVALRSVSLSVPDLDATNAFFAGLGLPRSDTPLHAPEHESLWGLTGALTTSRVYNAGSVLLEAVQYLDPIARPRTPGHCITDQGILNIAFGEGTRSALDDLYRTACRAGARPNSSPLHIPGAGVVYVNDPQGFSVELLWMSPRSGKHWGFTARPRQRRPKADTHAVTESVRIAAPIQATWDAVTDHDAMNGWLTPGSVRRLVDGNPERNGRGSQRQLSLPGTRVTEQVVTFEPPATYRYRVIQGSPFTCHQGEITLRPHGVETDLDWTIRFRPKLPGTGRLLAVLLSAALRRTLRTGLTPHIESRLHEPAGSAQHAPDAGARP